MPEVLTSLGFRPHPQRPEWFHRNEWAVEIVGDRWGLLWIAGEYYEGYDGPSELKEAITHLKGYRDV